MRSGQNVFIYVYIHRYMYIHTFLSIFVILFYRYITGLRKYI